MERVSYCSSSYGYIYNFICNTISVRYTLHLRFGNKRVNATLTLGFSNISDGEAGLILAHYDDVNADWDYVKFTSDNGTAGIVDPGSGNFLTKEIAGDDNTGRTRLGLKWRYASPPSVTSTFKGRSNVSCSFVACLDSP